MMLTFKLNYNGEDITIPMNTDDLEFEYGYCPLYFNIEGTYFSGVIDENYQIVVPFISEENEEDFSVITIFQENKAIYGVKNKSFYLIDLKDAEFEIKNDVVVPKNFIMRFDAYDDIDQKRAIIYKNRKYFIYDVCDEKKLSLDFEYIDNKDDDLTGTMILVPDQYTRELYLNCHINKEGQIKNPLHLGCVSIWLNNEFLEDKDKILEETSKIFQKEFTNDNHWDRILH